MRAYVLSRLAQTALVVFLSLTAVFGLVRLTGDPVLLFMPTDIQAKDVSEFRERLGFNDPLFVQYARFVGGAVRRRNRREGQRRTTDGEGNTALGRDIIGPCIIGVHVQAHRRQSRGHCSERTR